MATLLDQVRGCRLCADALPQGPRPVLQFHPHARLLIAAQAPGRRVHASGIPFDDASGERLRHWLGLTREVFYDPQRVAILPMAFCYPGTGAHGDLPPPPACAQRWRTPLLARLTRLRLTLLIGSHAQAWHLRRRASLTDTVAAWRSHGPSVMPLPHPSPRNNRWLARHPWFEREVLPELKARVAQVLAA